MEMKEICLKMCHCKFNGRDKSHSAKLRTRYTQALEDKNILMPDLYMLPAVTVNKSNKARIMERQFKNKSEHALWTNEEIELLVETLKKIARGDLQVLAQDPYYWIAHHVFQRKKQGNEIKKFIRKKFTMFSNY